MKRHACWIALIGCLVALGCSSDEDGDGGGAGSAGAAGSAGTAGAAGAAGATGGTGGSAGSLMGGSGGVAGEGGSDDAGTEGGDASACEGAGEALGFEPACSSCVNQTCCADAEACKNNADCVDMLTCALACEPTEAGPEITCLQDCGGQYPDGISNFNALVLCLGNGCTACPF